MDIKERETGEKRKNTINRTATKPALKIGLIDIKKKFLKKYVAAGTINKDHIKICFQGDWKVDRSQGGKMCGVGGGGGVS